MINLDEYTKLKRRLDQFEKKKQRAAGAFEQLMKQLKKEFGCRTIIQAKKKLKKLKDEQSANEKKFNREIKKFKADFECFVADVETNDRRLNEAAPVGKRSGDTRTSKRQKVTVPPLGLE